MYVLLVLTSSWLGYLQNVLKHELHIKVKGNMLYEANVRWLADWMAAGCALVVTLSRKSTLLGIPRSDSPVVRRFFSS